MLQKHIPAPIRKLLRPLKRKLTSYFSSGAKVSETPTIALLCALPPNDSPVTDMLHSLRSTLPVGFKVEFVISCHRTELRARQQEAEAAISKDPRIALKCVGHRKAVTGAYLLRAAGQAAGANWILIAQPRTRFVPGYFELVYRDLARLSDIRAIQTMPQIYREAIKLTLNHPLHKYMLPIQRSVTTIDIYAKNARPTADGLWMRRLDLLAALALTQSKQATLPIAELMLHWLKLPRRTKVILLPEATIVSNSRSNLEALGGSRQLSVATLENTVEIVAQEIELYLANGDPIAAQLAVFRMIEVLKFLTTEAVVEGDLSNSKIDDMFQRLRRAGQGMGVKWLSSLRLPGFTQEIRVAMLALIHDAPLAGRSINLRGIDPAGKMVQFSFVRDHREVTFPQITCNTVPREPEFISSKRLRFLGCPFVEEVHFWIPLGSTEQVEFRLNKAALAVRRGGKMINKSPTLAQLAQALAPLPVIENTLNSYQQATRSWALSSTAEQRYDGCWLLLDRVDKADDNAEHLYRFLLREGKAKRAFFILDQASPDWARLLAEGFQLIAHDSSDHIAALAHADLVLSSHSSANAISPPRSKAVADHLNYRFVFLQHGVIQNEMSEWLNRVKIDLFVTSSEAEKASISDIETDYIFSDKEVVLTGLPRHDALVTGNAKRDAIVITPTWRRSLLNAADSSEQATKRLLDSPFWRNWLDYLASPKLMELARVKGLDIIFVPHPNLVPLLARLNLPAHIHVFNPMTDGSYQDIFRRTALGVTDYSSTATEIAYCNVPVIYFQFDYDDVYGGAHTFKKGYFDHKSHGFGPVCMTAEALLRQTESILTTGLEDVYLKRLESSFLPRDGNCCKRVYEAVLSLCAPADVAIGHQSVVDIAPIPPRT